MGHAECFPDHPLIRLAVTVCAVIQQVIEFLLDQVFFRFGQDTHGIIPDFCKINEFRLYFAKSAAGK
jgi:hypothetical protein